MDANQKLAQEFVDDFKGNDGVKGNPFSEQLELNIVASLTGVFKNYEKRLRKEIEMKRAMETFIRRCENGEIRSRRTYSQFKDILDL